MFRYADLDKKSAPAEAGTLSDRSSGRSVPRELKLVELEVIDQRSVLVLQIDIELEVPRPLADDDLAVVVKAANITSLSLIGNPRVTNRGMKTLASLKNLQQLYLTDTSVTDTALADLRRMPGLRQLTVRAAKFWQGGKSPIGALKFEIIDATRTYQVPTELFSPLH